MSSNDANDRKRKILEAVSSNNGRNPNKERNKAHRVSTIPAALNTTDLQVNAPLVTAKASTANTASTEHEESIRSIGKLIQALLYSDNAEVNATLDALDLNLDEDEKKCKNIQAVGGCFVLVQLVKNCLDKTIHESPACDQVTDLYQLADLPTLHDTLCVITRLTFKHDESKFGITVVGGVEAVVEVMKTFPKCEMLQECAFGALLNLTCNNVTGKKKANERGGIEAVIVAIDNHLGSAILCEFAIASTKLWCCMSSWHCHHKHHISPSYKLTGPGLVSCIRIINLQ
jgi:hypothetical protein